MNLHFREYSSWQFSRYEENCPAYEPSRRDLFNELSQIDEEVASRAANNPQEMLYVLLIRQTPPGDIFRVYDECMVDI